MGSPVELAQKYYDQGADEILYTDIVASLYRREIDFEQIRMTAKDIYAPFAVGGGVRSLDDFSRLLHLGADKVAINTYALQEDPTIVDRAARVFGSQAVIVNIEAKWIGYWECNTDCGRIGTGKNVLDWVKEVQERGAGEILLQSIDKDGRRQGFDLPLVGEVVQATSIPVVAASGAWKLSDVVNLVSECQPSGVAVASMLHYGKCTVEEIKNALKS